MNTVLWKTVCKQWRKTPNMKDNPEILALVYVTERPITVHHEDSDKDTVFEEIVTYRPSIDILYYPEECEGKGELIKAGHYVSLRKGHW